MSASSAISEAQQKLAEEEDNIQSALDRIEQSLPQWTSRVGEYSTLAKFLSTELENPNIGARIQEANANASVLTWQGLEKLAWDRTKFALNMLTMPFQIAGQMLAMPFTNMYESWQRFSHLNDAGVNVFGAAIDAATMPFFEQSGIAGVYTGFTHKDLYTGQTYSEGEAQWRGFVGGMTVVLNVAMLGEFAAAGKAGSAAKGLLAEGEGFADDIVAASAKARQSNKGGLLYEAPELNGYILEREGGIVEVIAHGTDLERIGAAGVERALAGHEMMPMANARRVNLLSCDQGAATGVGRELSQRTGLPVVAPSIKFGVKKPDFFFPAELKPGQTYWNPRAKAPGKWVRFRE